MSNEHDETQEFLDSLPELTEGDTFCFDCHPGVACFNACCSELNLMLTPYDVLRIRRGLGMSSRAFLKNHAELHVQPDTGLPMFRLLMDKTCANACPFVSPEGCAVYPDRPGACRTYPLGRASQPGHNGEAQERFFIVREDHCKGFQQGTVRTSDEWLEDQGLEEYNRLNDRYMRILSKQRKTGAPAQSKKANMAVLALYQLDSFRDFIRDMGVLDRLELDPERKERIMEDEAERLEFAFDWLELILFGESPNLEPRK
jgi:hypothetical protein